MRRALHLFALFLLVENVSAESRPHRGMPDTFPRLPVLTCAACGDPEEHHTNYGAVVYNKYVYEAGPKIFADAATGTPYVLVTNPSNGKYAIVWIEFIYDPAVGTKLLKFKINVQPPNGKATPYFSAGILTPHAIEPVKPQPAQSSSSSRTSSPNRPNAGRGGRAGAAVPRHYSYPNFYGPGFSRGFGSARSPFITITEMPRDGR